MPETTATQDELFGVAELPGRPMLHWHGKRPLHEIPYYPAQRRERYGEGEPPDDTRGVVVICAGHEYDVPETIKTRNVLDIPFEVRDVLTDRKDVIFKRPPEAEVSLDRDNGQTRLTVEQFYSPLLLQKLSLEDDTEAVEDWRQMVAAVLIDPAYDGEVFHARITDAPSGRGELRSVCVGCRRL